MTTAAQKSLPNQMTISRPGDAIYRASPNIGNPPFWAEMLFDSTREGEWTVMRTVYEPGSTPNWHSHPLGQFLYILSGVALVQREGGPVVEMRAGDCAWFAPGERQWHGAAPTSTMSYLSIQGFKDGRYTDWMEPVSKP